jgi:hypothetical protein
MNSDTRSTLRKLAREATIFALLGMLAFIGVFVKLDGDDRAEARSKATVAVHAAQNVPAGFPVDGSVQVPLTNGTVLQVLACQPPHQQITLPQGYEDAKPANQDTDCITFSTDPPTIRDRLPLGNTDQVAIERDYWIA